MADAVILWLKKGHTLKISSSKLTSFGNAEGNEVGVDKGDKLAPTKNGERTMIKKDNIDKSNALEEYQKAKK